MTDEHNPEGPELDDVFEQPVQCCECGNWHELENSNFFTAKCDCTEGCTHGYCDDCLLERPYCEKNILLKKLLKLAWKT